MDITKDILISTSTLEDYKYSYHVIVDNYKLINVEQCKMFCEKVLDSVGKRDSVAYRTNIIANGLDLQIYDKNHSLRALLSTKRSDLQRVKVPLHQPDGLDPAHHFVTYTDGCKLLHPLHDFLTEEEAIMYDLVEVAIDEQVIYQEILHKHFGQDWTINWDKQEGLYVNVSVQSFPYMCQICNKTHKSNTPYLLVQNNGIFLACRRSEYHDIEFPNNRIDLDAFYPEGRVSHYSKPLTTKIKEEDRDKGDMKLYHDRATIIEEIKKMKEWATFVGLPGEPDEPCIYTADKIKDYCALLDTHKRLTILIWSKMDSYKTRTFALNLVKHQKRDKILKYLETLEDEQAREDVERFLAATENIRDFETVGLISSRKSFAFNIQAVLASDSFGLDFAVYKQEGYNSKHMFVVQCESLYSSNILPQVLILDEITSILVQMTSRFHRQHITDNHKRFRAWMEKADIVIMMDGDVDIRTINCIKEFRPTVPLHVQINNRKVDNIKATEVNSVAQLAFLLRQRVALGKNVMFPTGSLKAAEVICSILDDIGLVRNQKRDVDKGIKAGYCFVNISTGDEELKFINSNINELWVCYQVVIFTSIITTGIDFHMKYFHSVFCYALPMSNCIREVFQMIGRCRHILDNEIVFCISGLQGKVQGITSTLLRDNINKSLEDCMLEVYKGIKDNKEYEKIIHETRYYASVEEVSEVVNRLLISKLDNNYFTNLFLDNKVEQNLSRRHCREICYMTLESRGYELVRLPSDLSRGQIMLYEMKRIVVRDKAIIEISAAFDRHIDLPQREYERLTTKTLNNTATAIDKQNLLFENFKRFFKDRVGLQGKDFYLIRDCRLIKPMLCLVTLMTRSMGYIIDKDLTKFERRSKEHGQLVFFKPKFIQLSIITKILRDLGFPTVFDTEHVITRDVIVTVYKDLLAPNPDNKPSGIIQCLAAFKRNEDVRNNILSGKVPSFISYLKHIIGKMTGFILLPNIRPGESKRKKKTYGLVQPISNYMTLIQHMIGVEK